MSFLTQIDTQLEQLLAAWSIYSTLICGAIAIYVLLPLFFYKEPDTHPLLLARQSSASRVRYPGESAIFRSLETPHGYPLRAGLNVKDPGAPKWTSGREGDVRDVWRRAKEGPVDNDGKISGKPGAVSTVLGKEQVSEHGFNSLSIDISSAGKHLSDHGGQRIAIYLSNSVELLVTLFCMHSPSRSLHILIEDSSMCLLRSHANLDTSRAAGEAARSNTQRHKSRYAGSRRRCCASGAAYEILSESKEGNLGSTANKSPYGLDRSF